MQRRVFGTYIKKINAVRSKLETAIRIEKAKKKAATKRLGGGGGGTPKTAKKGNAKGKKFAVKRTVAPTRWSSRVPLAKVVYDV